MTADSDLRVDFLRGIVMRAPGMTTTRDFYEKNWGLKPAAQKDGVVYFRGTGPEQYIYGLRDADVYGIDYINFGMNSRERVNALYTKMKNSGVRILGRPAEVDTPGGGFGFTAYDPDNRALRFVSDVAGHSDTEDDIAQPRKVSHIVLNTPRMDVLRTFYEEMMGFRVSDYSAAQMVFMRVTSDHHAIAFATSPYPSANHVAFEMPSIDSFMRGIGRMKTAGQAPAWGPGRHGPGNNPFAYFVSPSGFVIEFTAEIQQIDEETHQPQVWPRDVPEKMDVWMTAGPPTPAMRAVMQGRPDPGMTG
jgi:catechol 2,3-dioxygenase-like lactoylglutathione lyase family enzyme